MKALGYGEGYRYAHDDPEAVEEMECFPPSLVGRKYLGRRSGPNGRKDGRGAWPLLAAMAPLVLFLGWLVAGERTEGSAPVERDRRLGVEAPRDALLWQPHPSVPVQNFLVTSLRPKPRCLGAPTTRILCDTRRRRNAGSEASGQAGDEEILNQGTCPPAPADRAPVGRKAIDAGTAEVSPPVHAPRVGPEGDLRWHVSGRIRTVSGRPVAMGTWPCRFAVSARSWRIQSSFAGFDFSVPTWHEATLELDEDGAFTTPLPQSVRFGDTFRLCVGPREGEAPGLAGRFPEHQATGELAVSEGGMGVSGTCVDLGGRPVPGVVVLVPDSEAGIRASAMTDELGRFRIDRWLSEPALLLAGGGGWACERQPIHVLNGARDLEVVVARSGEVMGNVLIGGGSEQLGLQHTLSNPEESLRRVLEVGDGTFHFTNVPAGTYRYRLESAYDVLGQSIEPVVLYEVDRIEVAGGSVARDPRLNDIRLDDHLEFAVLTVTDEEGELLRGNARVVVHHAGGRVERRGFSRHGRSVLVAPDFEGAYALVHHERYRTQRVDPLESCSLRLRPAPTVRLVAEIPNSVEKERIHVVVSDAQLGEQRELRVTRRHRPPRFPSPGPESSTSISTSTRGPSRGWSPSR